MHVDIPGNVTLLSAESLWIAHRNALGGRSAISGAALPETLDECSPGVKGAHWGIACYVAIVAGAAEPTLPSGVAPEDADRIRSAIRDMFR